MAKHELYEPGDKVVNKIFLITMVAAVLFIASGFVVVFL